MALLAWVAIAGIANADSTSTLVPLPGDDQWAFRPIHSKRIPTRELSSISRQFVTNPLDAFVCAELEKHGLTASPRADRRTWLRRVYFGLIGLPPSPDAFAAFEKDSRP